ncbi:CLUMA_CG008674, isoform A [Clunio marinus]|uniref:CLUMA_CG008674, isoform A n=1 Tax=Clunio marinus TaxID=568069 RepID=A0A1J1I8T3_9DIPT|nr:CLUMA_CG008674, isoform A [Clunio marinus]
MKQLPKLYQSVEGITVKPSEISITTSKPMMKLTIGNKTIHRELQMRSPDNRIRRLIHPYMPYYFPTNDYNNPREYRPLHQNMMVRKKPPPQIPSIALLYGGPSKFPPHRPAVTAGFVYKARPEPFKTYTRFQPQMQPSYNNYNYQPLSSGYHPQVNQQIVATSEKPNFISEKNNFTPFLDTNKLPGDFVPIFKNTNLPYKSYAENYVPNSGVRYHSKLVPSNDYNKITASTVKFSTPTPVFITTEAPQISAEFPSSPENSYDYIEISDPTTTPLPPSDYHTVKVTTFAPDPKFIEKIKILAAQKQYEEELADIHTSSPKEVLSKLQQTNHLPETFTPDNVDNSIKTLVKILNNMKHKELAKKPPTVYSNQADEDYDGYDDYDDTIKDGSPGPNSGRPGIDYPNFHEIPQTTFTCRDQRYKGFFGDPETDCQVWHYCDLNGGKASFLCPNGTIFSQIALTCDWWFNVRCSTTPQLYVLNERLYKYILPFTPKFPEDYSGPLVDKYLAIKFQEMEEKLKLEKEKEREEELKKLTEESSEVKQTQNELKDEIEIQSDESEDEATVERSSVEISQENMTYTSDPIINPILDVPKSTPQPVLELPPIPKTIVEQERIELIEIKNDGTSGHLTHDLH